MRNDLSEQCKATFALAWESYVKDTIQIGAVIVDSDNKIISRVRNRSNFNRQRYFSNL